MENWDNVGNMCNFAFVKILGWRVSVKYQILVGELSECNVSFL